MNRKEKLKIENELGLLETAEEIEARGMRERGEFAAYLKDELHNDYCGCDDKNCGTIPKLTEKEAIAMVVNYLIHDEAKDYYYNFDKTERDNHIYIALVNLSERSEKK